MSTYNLNRYPSMGSVHSTTNLGYMPHSRAYLPLKTGPEKPYGPSFVNVMNRMWRGSGKKYVIYAVICLCTAILFFVGGALYFGHRNVSRMVVLNTEVLGALMIAAGILFTGAFFHFMYQANVASNRWRRNIRFRAEGLSSVAAYNKAYTPDEDKLKTGTYGPLAIKELTRGKPNKSRSRGFSRGYMSGAITPRTPLIYAEQDMSYRVTEMGGDESMRSSVQWPSKPPGPPETEIWPQPSRGMPLQRPAQDVQKDTNLSQYTTDASMDVYRSQQQQQVYQQPPMATPSPPPPPPSAPPPPPTALPPVNRQPVSSTKKPAASISPPPVSTVSQPQQQKPGQGQGAGRAALRMSYDGSESEL